MQKRWLVIMQLGKKIPGQHLMSDVIAKASLSPHTHTKKANKSKQKKNPKITRQYKITTTQKFTDHSCMNLSCRPSMHSETRIWTAGIRHYYNLCITKQRNETKKNTCIVLKMRELWQNSVCIDKQFSGRKFLRKWEKVNLKKKKRHTFRTNGTRAAALTGNFKVITVKAQ